MLSTHTTATQLKQNTAAIINQVYYQNQPIVIEMYGKPFVKIVPIDQDPIIETPQVKKKLKKYFGSIPNLETPKRFFRDKDLSLNTKN